MPSSLHTSSPLILRAVLKLLEDLAKAPLKTRHSRRSPPTRTRLAPQSRFVPLLFLLFFLRRKKPLPLDFINRLVVIERERDRTSHYKKNWGFEAIFTGSDLLVSIMKIFSEINLKSWS